MRVPKHGVSHLGSVVEMPDDRLGEHARVAGFGDKRVVIGELGQRTEIAHHHRDATRDRQESDAALARLRIRQHEEGRCGEQPFDLGSRRYNATSARCADRPGRAWPRHRSLPRQVAPRDVVATPAASPRRGPRRPCTARAGRTGGHSETPAERAAPTAASLHAGSRRFDGGRRSARAPRRAPAHGRRTDRRARTSA